MAPKVLISDELSDAAVQIFRDRGIDVDFQPKLGKDKDALAGIEGAHRAEAMQIRAALGRIAAGKYGICRICGCEIPERRLAALPTATLCIACVVN